MKFIEPDVLYANGTTQAAPALVVVGGGAGPRGRTGAEGRQGPAGPTGTTGPAGPSELGGSTSGIFPNGDEVYFGPDGDLFATLPDVVAGRIVGQAQTLRYLTAKCNEVPAGRQLTVAVRISEDDGATWSSAASVVVDEGNRSASSEVNVTIPAGSLHCVSVYCAGYEYTGPVSWLLHN